MKIIFRTAIITIIITVSAIFMGGIYYSVFRMQIAENIREALFWSALILIFSNYFYRCLDSILGRGREKK